MKDGNSNQQHLLYEVWSPANQTTLLSTNLIIQYKGEIEKKNYKFINKIEDLRFTNDFLVTVVLIYTQKRQYDKYLPLH